MADRLTYNDFRYRQGAGLVDLTAATWKISLILNSYTFNPDHVDFGDDVQPDEYAGAGYTAGGVVLTSPTWTIDVANDAVVWAFEDVIWPSLGTAGDGAVINAAVIHHSTTGRVAVYIPTVLYTPQETGIILRLGGADGCYKSF